PDSAILQYFELLTSLPLDNLPENPRDRQKLLALEIVSQYHGPAAALEAQKAALNLVQGDATKAAAVPEFSLGGIQFPAKLSYILGASGLCKSSSDGRRQIHGGAVRLDGDRLDNPDASFDAPNALIGKVLQVGKNRFARLVP
ncbi:MAG: tyrosine--tRNA ligase, partial [Cyanobacteria bacterium J069]